MKNAKSIICAATLVLAVSVSTAAKPGTISATKAGTIAATKTGVISATTSGTSTQATGIIPATRTGIIPTQAQRSLGSVQVGFLELLLTVFQPW